MRRRPSDIKYSPTHCWVRLESTSGVIIGVTDHSLKDAEKIVSVKLSKKGGQLKQDSPFGKIETEDTSYSLFAPISGKVVKVNKEVLNNPEIILEEPYDDGWLIMVKPEDKAELDALMNAREYDELIAEEEEEEREEIFGGFPEEEP